jgi:hypothetical protein
MAQHVEVIWVGLECRQKQENGFDEVMGHVIRISPGIPDEVHKFPNDRETWNMGREDERIVNVQVPLYTGPPVPLTLTAHLVEHDSTAADIELYKQRTREAVASIASAALAAGAGVSLPALNGMISDLSRALVNGVSDLIGAGDDPYNPTSVALDMGAMTDPNRPRRLATRPDDPKRVSYTPLNAVNEFITVTGRDDGGDVGEYRFYFDVRVSGTPDQPGAPPARAGEEPPTPPPEPGPDFGAGDGVTPPPQPPDHVLEVEE